MKRWRISVMRLLNVVGLGFGILGAIIMFKWGSPQPDFRQESYLLLESSSPEWIAAQKTNEYKYQVLSKIGLGFVMLGFLSQLTATLIPYSGDDYPKLIIRLNHYRHKRFRKVFRYKV